VYSLFNLFIVGNFWCS